MDRSDAIAELEKFTELATVAQCDTGDSRAGFGSAIDSALREMGFVSSELADAEVAEADEAAFLALCDYYALKMLKVYLAPKAVDIAYTANDGTVNKKRSQTMTAVDSLLADAREEVRRLGYLDSDFEIVSFNTNWIEPSSAEI
jgi:hypothetical protein